MPSLDGSRNRTALWGGMWGTLGSGAEGQQLPQLRKGQGSSGGSWKITKIGAGTTWDSREPQALGWGSGEMTARG